MNDLKIGQLLLEDAGRDAIHVAVVPVLAGINLAPGDHIGFITDSLARSVARISKPIGIVDPFLTGRVYEGDKFWMFLYPRSTTSLSHVWTHPAFTEQVEAKAEESEHVQWLKWFAEECGLSYDKLIEVADEWITHGDTHMLDKTTPDCVYSYKQEFWVHYKAVTGKKPNDPMATFIDCSC